MTQTRDIPIPVEEFQEKLSRHVNEIRTAEEARAERHQTSEAKRERQLENRRQEAEAAEKRMAEEATLRAQQTHIEEQQEEVKAKVVADAKILETARIERETRGKVQSQQREIRDRVAADAEKLAEETGQLGEARRSKTVLRQCRGEDESRFKFAHGDEVVPPLSPKFLRDVKAIVEEDEKNKNR